MKNNYTYPGAGLIRAFSLCSFIAIATCFYGCAHAYGQEVNVTNPVPMPAMKDATLSGGLQQVYDSLAGSTNFAIVISGGRGVKGDKNLAFADYVYNLSGNVGLVLGYDAIRASGNNTTYNFVKGGLQLKADIYPLKNFGLTDFKVTPFAAILMSSHDGSVGEIIVAGASHRWALSKSWGFNVGGFYENRTGGNDSSLNGVYICGFAAFSRNF